MTTPDAGGLAGWRPVEQTLLPTVRRAYERLKKKGSLAVPAEISWRSAHTLVHRGVATLYPFERRWAGRLTLATTTPARAGEEK